MMAVLSISWLLPGITATIFSSVSGVYKWDWSLGTPARSCILLFQLLWMKFFGWETVVRWYPGGMKPATPLPAVYRRTIKALPTFFSLKINCRRI
jgi:hypothetical protein